MILRCTGYHGSKPCFHSTIQTTRNRLYKKAHSKTKSCRHISENPQSIHQQYSVLVMLVMFLFKLGSRASFSLVCEIRTHLLLQIKSFCHFGHWEQVSCFRLRVYPSHQGLGL